MGLLGAIAHDVKLRELALLLTSQLPMRLAKINRSEVVPHERENLTLYKLDVVG